MDRCWLRGQIGDALHTVLCATGYNLRWLLRAMVRLGLKAIFLRSLWLALLAAISGNEDRRVVRLRQASRATAGSGILQGRLRCQRRFLIQASRFTR